MRRSNRYAASESCCTPRFSPSSSAVRAAIPALLFRVYPPEILRVTRPDSDHSVLSGGVVSRPRQQVARSTALQFCESTPKARKVLVHRMMQARLRGPACHLSSISASVPHAELAATRRERPLHAGGRVCVAPRHAPRVAQRRHIQVSRDPPEIYRVHVGRWLGAHPNSPTQLTLSVS